MAAKEDRNEWVGRIRALEKEASDALVGEEAWARTLEAVLGDCAIDEDKGAREPGVYIHPLEDVARMREKILEHCARRAPAALVPHLERLVRDDLVPLTDPAGLPFRAAEPAQLRELEQALSAPPTTFQDETDPERARQRSVLRKALRALLEGRGLVPRDGYGDVAEGRADDFYSQRVLHLGFDRALQPDRAEHPTWRVPAEGDRIHRFGGALAGEERCSICGYGLHHILTIDPLPDGLGVTGLERLTLATCLSCLGWDLEWPAYRHDASGRPAPKEEPGDDPYPPQLKVGSLRETRVALVDLGPAWAFQSWGESNGNENLNRLGGCPTWVQNASFRPCQGCGTRMRALLQLDSRLPLTDDATVRGATHIYRGRSGDRPQFNWGSGGVGYALWCDACKESRWFWQCT